DQYGLATTLPTRREARPEKEQAPASVEKVGVELADVTSDAAERFGLGEDVKGVLITRVEPESPASVAGLRRGMIVLKIDNKSVASADGARQTLEKASLDKGVLLQVQTAQGTTEYV